MRLVFVLTILLCGCVSKKAPEPALNLVVAASAGPAAQRLVGQLEKSHGLKISLQTGASSLLARQITSGLACDVVILADDDWMDHLSKEKAIDASTRRPLLGNQLVWIVNKKQKNDEANPRIAVADPSHVPAGKYAKKALIEAGMWEKISTNIVPAPDVRTALLWVERGELSEGIVYESDAVSSDKVKIKFRFEENPKSPIHYPIARCHSKHKRADELYQLLLQTGAAETFREFGFTLVNRAHEPS